MTVLEACVELYKEALEKGLPYPLEIEKHVKYLRDQITQELGPSMRYINPSRIWLGYWVAHSLSLLDAIIPEDVIGLREFVLSCQHPDGGFGGSPGMGPHLATTYAGTMCLATLGDTTGLSGIDRPKMLQFLLSCKTDDNFFVVHKNGEKDLRAPYLAISTASILGILTPQLSDGVADAIAGTQRYDGGIPGETDGECHAGYAYCGAAVLGILGAVSKINVLALRRWCVARQMEVEGGFQGRSNKLVDSCYSFWLSGTLAILNLTTGGPSHELEVDALTNYLLVCCQAASGGY